MEDERYIWIPRWREFQHYPPDRDRAPAWIKDYPKQLDDERYLDLTDRQRALVRDLRDIFAIAHGRIRRNARMIARRRNCHTRDADLEALNHAGLIEFCSRVTLEQRLEDLYSNSRPRARRGEGEKENLKTKTAPLPLPPKLATPPGSGDGTAGDGTNETEPGEPEPNFDWDAILKEMPE